MKRREFIAGLLLSATIRRAQAQKLAKVYRIAVVHPSRQAAEMTETSPHRPYRTFFQELRRLGYVEGQNLVIERYSGEEHAENYSELASNVASRRPDLILAMGDFVWRFKAVTALIPIVAFTEGDPIVTGLVPSLARPGGNITGVNIDAGSEIWGKRFELLREVVPKMSRVGILTVRVYSKSVAAGPIREVREAAQRVGIVIVGPAVDSPIEEPEYRRVFTAMSQEGADGIIVGSEGENSTNRRLIVELAEKAGLAAMYPFREYVEVGGLMAYAVDFNELYRALASQIGQILKGTNPGEIPYYLPTKFELIINLKTANALGLAMPPALLARADEVIE